MTQAPVTFALASGGHNVGIVSPPGNPRGHCRIATREENEPSEDAGLWMAKARPVEGSWWSEWVDWLAQHSGKPVVPPGMGLPETFGTPLEDAPGSYVRVR